VFETVDMRVDKSLSDLKGTDPKIHGGRIQGVFGELRDVFRRRGQAADGETDVANLPRVEERAASDTGRVRGGFAF